MDEHSAETYRRVAQAAWRWVLDQVRWDDGPWVPTTGVPPGGGGAPAAAEPPDDRDGVHSGVAGLALALAEIRLARPWDADEEALATAIADRLREQALTTTDCTWFDGLPGSVGALIALRETGAETALGRLTRLATPDGWPQTILGPPRLRPGARISDLTLGTAGVLMAALWAHRTGVAGAREVADRAADVLLAEAEPVPSGTTWRFVPERFHLEPGTEMPNLSHGVAGVATALALAGTVLGRPALTEAARSGAEHLVTLGDTRAGGFVVPTSLRPSGVPADDTVAYGWCHGPSGTRLLFLALERAGVRQVAGEPPLAWHRRCLNSVRGSGLPERPHPGFWDNDGRCCGTAGVGEAFLDAWQRAGDPDDLGFAVTLADALVDRAEVFGPHACWQFLEHRLPDPVLPPGVGWMQGAAGISAHLFRVSRVLRDGRSAEAVHRPDNWWTTAPERTLP